MIINSFRSKKGKSENKEELMEIKNVINKIKCLILELEHKVKKISRNVERKDQDMENWKDTKIREQSRRSDTWWIKVPES